MASIPTNAGSKNVSDNSLLLRDDIKPVLRSFLEHCDLKYPRLTLDRDFLALTAGEAQRRGYPMDGPHSISPFLPTGVAIATTSYEHLEKQSTKVLIALFTACATYADDVFQSNTRAVNEFNRRFIRHQPQMNPALDALADTFLEMDEHFDRLPANMIITSSLNGVSALLLEGETQGMELSLEATEYPVFVRLMSGYSEAYGMFIFPPSLPVTAFIQALPQIKTFINNTNDIMSFYKEELASETVNYISLLARHHRISKIDALRRVVDETTNAYLKSLVVLSQNDEAYAAYKKFAQGYIGFHAVLSERYKLHELEL